MEERESPLRDLSEKFRLSFIRRHVYSISPEGKGPEEALVRAVLLNRSRSQALSLSLSHSRPPLSPSNNASLCTQHPVSEWSYVQAGVDVSK